MGDKVNLRIDDRDTLHNKVVSVLRKAILKGDFKPGSRLVQSDLADSLGVSRMPVREALRKLEIEGLVTLEPHRGAIVNSIQIDDILEIYELRSQLEKMAVEQSVKLLNEEDLIELSSLVDDMEETDSVDVFVEANINFHRLLIHRCPWKRLTTFIETLWNGFAQETPQVISGQMQKSNKEHREILEAVKNKDEIMAAQLMAKHINRTKLHLVEAIKNQNNEDRI
ncbi:GntR family transcriptional regulator [Alkalihalobacillus sp. MEB130]|uniref:GntR family transcriptional regulator n=1 Tax=Alkalihalobacillus sp. MEB130 TaxID=2976704 RepID=UPI0028DDB44B|nr:GntR family transcriptional regulator [Alkalihalobacillus sp. MEB130]MDT8861003.1 GntR family transcriptional regulator [Alkalihalobacillus sp. MEB130]